jgi:XRE family transcriptional regulator of biofilm formation
MLRKLREERGLTQRDLAEKAGTTGAYIAMLETGVKKNPSLDLLKQIAKALKVKVGELLE